MTAAGTGIGERCTGDRDEVEVVTSCTKRQSEDAESLVVLDGDIRVSPPNRIFVLPSGSDRT